MKRPTFRLATPADYPEVCKRHEEQNARDGTDYPLPAWFDERGKLLPNIALACVVELDGEVLQGVFFECKQVELCLAGCDPRATAVSWREIDGTSYLLKQMGFTGIHCLVPSVVEEEIEKPLTRAGFRKNQHLTDFYKRIGGDE